MSRESWGWNNSLEEKYENRKAGSLEAGRVIKEVRHTYTLASGTASDEDEYLLAEVSGAFQYKAAGPADYPAIGDWVLFRRASEDKAIIEDILPRVSCFSRKVAGGRTDEQVLAANIDIIYLVFGINGGRNFTSGGLERYMTLAWDSGALPVIVLNKADLCTEEEKEKALLTGRKYSSRRRSASYQRCNGRGLFGTDFCFETGKNHSPHRSVRCREVYYNQCPGGQAASKDDSPERGRSERTAYNNTQGDLPACLRV